MVCYSLKGFFAMWCWSEGPNQELDRWGQCEVGWSFYHIPYCFPCCPCYLSGSGKVLFGGFVGFLTEIGIISFIPSFLKLDAFGTMDKMTSTLKFVWKFQDNEWTGILPRRES